VSGRLVALGCVRIFFRLYSGVAPPFGRTLRGGHLFNLPRGESNKCRISHRHRGATPITVPTGKDNPAVSTVRGQYTGAFSFWLRERRRCGARIDRGERGDELRRKLPKLIGTDEMPML
jgi:hypothetical protein